VAALLEDGLLEDGLLAGALLSFELRPALLCGEIVGSRYAVASSSDFMRSRVWCIC